MDKFQLLHPHIHNVDAGNNLINTELELESLDGVQMDGLSLLTAAVVRAFTLVTFLNKVLCHLPCSSLREIIPQPQPGRPSDHRLYIECSFTVPGQCPVRASAYTYTWVNLILYMEMVLEVTNLMCIYYYS